MMKRAIGVLSLCSCLWFPACSATTVAADSQTVVVEASASRGRQAGVASVRPTSRRVATYQGLTLHQWLDAISFRESLHVAGMVNPHFGFQGHVDRMVRPSVFLVIEALEHFAAVDAEALEVLGRLATDLDDSTAEAAWGAMVRVGKLAGPQQARAHELARAVLQEIPAQWLAGYASLGASIAWLGDEAGDLAPAIAETLLAQLLAGFRAKPVPDQDQEESLALLRLLAKKWPPAHETWLQFLGGRLEVADRKAFAEILAAIAWDVARPDANPQERQRRPQAPELDAAELAQAAVAYAPASAGAWLAVAAAAWRANKKEPCQQALANCRNKLGNTDQDRELAVRLEEFTKALGEPDAWSEQRRSSTLF
jgi:hypothetical protein